MSMFCFQCEQTGHGTGCTKQGVCGKHDTTAALQDAIVQTSKEIGFYLHELRKSGKSDPQGDRVVLDLLFATVTNVNFDDSRLYELLREALKTAARLQKLSGTELPPDALISRVNLHPDRTMEEFIESARKLDIPSRKAELGHSRFSI